MRTAYRISVLLLRGEGATSCLGGHGTQGPAKGSAGRQEDKRRGRQAGKGQRAGGWSSMPACCPRSHTLLGDMLTHNDTSAIGLLQPLGLQPTLLYSSSSVPTVPPPLTCNMHQKCPSLIVICPNCPPSLVPNMHQKTLRLIRHRHLHACHHLPQQPPKRHPPLLVRHHLTTRRGTGPYPNSGYAQGLCNCSGNGRRDALKHN